MDNSNSMSQPLEYDLRNAPHVGGAVTNNIKKIIQKAIPMPTTMKRFQDKVAIVTESAEGVGFSIAERLGKEGASIVITTASIWGNLAGAAQKLRDQNINVLEVLCDVSNAKQRKELIGKTRKTYGKINIIVSNGVAKPSMNAILDTQERVLDQHWEVNVKSHLLLLKDAEPHLKEEGSSIIIVSTVTSDQPQASLGVNDVTKAALMGLTEALSKEMPPNVRINSVLSGFAPPRAAPHGHKITSLFKKDKGTSLSKLGSSTGMAATVAFLASDDASHITGETVEIFGGIASNL